MSEHIHFYTDRAMATHLIQAELLLGTRRVAEICEFVILIAVGPRRILSCGLVLPHALPTVGLRALQKSAKFQKKKNISCDEKYAYKQNYLAYPCVLGDGVL